MSLVQSRNSYSVIVDEKERNAERQTILGLRSVERTTTFKPWVLKNHAWAWCATTWSDASVKQRLWFLRTGN